MNNIIEKLKNFGLTEIESKVYITVLKSGTASGYKIAKELNLAKSTVYKAIDSLFNLGYLSMVPSEKKEYQAKEPSLLLKELEEKYKSNINTLKSELEKIRNTPEREYFYNIHSKENVFLKLKEFINNAEKEIFINTDFDLTFVKKEIISAEKRGVLIVIFSFTKHPEIGDNINIYSINKSKFHASNNRIMLACDDRKSLLIDNENDNYTGLFSNNKLLARIIYEHIHNDIYLLKIKNNHKGIFNKDMFINSAYEKNLWKHRKE